MLEFDSYHFDSPVFIEPNEVAAIIHMPKLFEGDPEHGASVILKSGECVDVRGDIREVAKKCMLRYESGGKRWTR